MKIRLPFLMFTFFLSIFIVACFPNNTFSQNTNIGIPTPPPVEINLLDKYISASIAEIIITVMPLDDMHTDIKCLLSEEVEVIQENGIMVVPYIEEMPRPGVPYSMRNLQSVELFIGPISAGVTKKFVFRVKKNTNQSQKIIVQIQALSKWGIKEGIFNLDI